MNIGKLLTKTARKFSEKPGIVYGPKKLTYGQFNARVNRLSNALKHLGPRQGDTVALLQYNYPETLESLFACFKAGLGAVPINWRLHPNEVSFIIDHSEAKALILSPEFNEPVAKIRERIPKIWNRSHILIRALSLSNSSLNVFSSLSLFLTIPARLLRDEYDKPNNSPIARLEKRPVCHRKYIIKSLSFLSASLIL